MELYQGYWAVIPARIRCDKTLSSNAKLLFGELSSLAQADGYCWARNAHFVSVLGVSERTVIRLLRELSDRGHIRTVILRDSKSGQVTGRRIFPFWNPSAMPEESESEMLDDNVTSQVAPFILDASRDENCHVLPPDKNDRWPPDENGTTLLTKMSGGINNEENKNNNIPPIVPREKTVKNHPDKAARAELRAWIDSFTDLPVKLHRDLTSAIMAFCDMRCDRRKPLRAGRAVTLLKHRLVQYSNNQPDIMVALLDEAILRQWDSVYPLKSGDCHKSSAPSGRDDGGPKWL